MTVRNFENNDVQRIEDVKSIMVTPNGEQFIDHIVYFKNGAIVAYGDSNREGFVWIIKASN